jgi:hypothetical protein
MNKFKLSAVAIIASLALTACGGGGGNNSNNQPKESTVNATQTTPAPKPIADLRVNIPMKNNNTASIYNKDYSLGSIDTKLKNSEGKEVAKFVGTNRSYSLHGVAVWSENGADNITQQLIDLQTGTNYSVGTANNRSQLEQVAMNVKGQALIDAVNNTFRTTPSVPYRTLISAGVITPPSVISDKDGNKTYSLPDTLRGKALYKGDAVRYDSLSLRARHVGETTLNVDFDKKTISGKINTDDHRRNIELKETPIRVIEPTETTPGYIGFGDKNSKENNAVAHGNHLYNTVSGNYSGQFYGPNAEEVGGIVRFGADGEAISSEDSTSFSAVKQ